MLMVVGAAVVLIMFLGIVASLATRHQSFSGRKYIGNASEKQPGKNAANMASHRQILAKSNAAAIKAVVASQPATDNCATYVPFSEASDADAVVCDCTHPERPTFTHHKGHRNPPPTLVTPGDTSTAIVLNAVTSGVSIPGWMDKKHVAVNHFDGDALFSAWAYINRAHATKHADLLRCAAALHDFREMLPKDHPLFEDALALCCWVNSAERAQFTPPYDDKDADDKFSFFLTELGSFLEHPQDYQAIWKDEFDRVVSEYQLIETLGRVEKYSALGLAVIASPRPVHYYSLFSHSVGCDVVLAMYDDQKYELEEKYTQFVNVHSRKVTARLDMGPLAVLLNEIDTKRDAGTAWASPSMVDTGPLLRLDVSGQKLSKGQRYGHPTARPMYSSGLHRGQFEALVVSFFEYGLRGVEGKVGGWRWDELHALNASIDWAAWAEEARDRYG